MGKKRFHALRHFEEMLDHLGVEYETVFPDIYSPALRDIHGITRIKVDGYEICFDDGNCFIGIKKGK